MACTFKSIETPLPLSRTFARSNILPIAVSAGPKSRTSIACAAKALPS